MVEYSKINCKLTNVQLNKFKKAVKSNEGATLRLGFKIFNKDELPSNFKKAVKSNEGATLRLGFKIFNKDELPKNLATDIKLSKA